MLRVGKPSSIVYDLTKNCCEKLLLKNNRKKDRKISLLMLFFIHKLLKLLLIIIKINYNIVFESFAIKTEFRAR